MKALKRIDGSVIAENGLSLKSIVVENSANLSAANLSDANLSGANLIAANLSGANLRWADLREANLREANLIEADLSDADLSKADLSGADLSKADLSGADLSKANLRWADLREADLSGADLSGANLSGANLSGAIGVSTKEEEMAECDRILSLLQISENKLIMDAWHTCKTSHCIAGWHRPDLPYPGQVASLAMLTMAKYFFASSEDAFAALERVASGQESVWNKE